VVEDSEGRLERLTPAEFDRRAHARSNP
jgi:hypothetical protein